MSPASEGKVQESEGYEAALLSRDCVQLWEFVRRTHLTHIYGDGDPMVQVNIQEQESRYAELRQAGREFLTSFKLRFDNQVKANAGAGVAPISDSKRALDFICKLDPKGYRSMLAKMRNNALSMEENAYPQSLSAAYRIASGWINEDFDRGFNGTDSHSAFVFENTDTPPAEKTPTIKTDKKSNFKAKKASNIICYVCEEAGHYARDCPKRKGKTVAFVVDHHTSDDYEDEEQYDEAAYVTTAEFSIFTRDDILLDSQASVNVFCNGELLDDIGSSDKEITLQGVQAEASGIKISQEGDFRTLGKVYYSPKTAANILSYAVMVDSGNKISYHQPSDTFTLTSKGDEETFTFKRKNAPGSEGRFYCCDMSKRGADRVLVEIVTENMRSYNKREVASAAKAREMLSKMGYPPVCEAIAIVENGKNFEITAHDFKVADAIWGSDLASLKGKTVKKPTVPGDSTTGLIIVQEEQTLAIDVMFVEGVPSLVGVSSPLDLTLAVSLTSLDTSKSTRCASVIKKGIMDMVSTLRSRNFFVTIIMTDGEGAIGAVSTELKQMGIELDVSGAGGHVSRIERRIRMIKERVGPHMSHKLPYELTTLGIAMLVLFCVSRINFQASRSRNGGPCPRELFSGRRADGAKDFRAAYGDYAQCTVPNTDNSMSARTEDCVVVLPTGNRTGTVKMLSLTTGRIVSRDQFRILPMPDSAMARLNELARREGRGSKNSTSREPEVTISRHSSASFNTMPTGETDDPIVRLTMKQRARESHRVTAGTM